MEGLLKREKRIKIVLFSDPLTLHFCQEFARYANVLLHTVSKNHTAYGCVLTHSLEVKGGRGCSPLMDPYCVSRERRR